MVWMSAKRLLPIHRSNAITVRAYINHRAELGCDGLTDALLVSEQGSGITAFESPLLPHQGLELCAGESSMKCFGRLGRRVLQIA